MNDASPSRWREIANDDAPAKALREIQSELRKIREAGHPIDGGTKPPHPPGMDDGWRLSVERAIGELRGSMDGFRHALTILSGAVGLLAAVTLGGLALMNNKIDKVAEKVDAIPKALSEEFRAMRAEMSAQTSAIANSITATRQAQPAPPQIVIVPPAPNGQQPKQ